MINIKVVVLSVQASDPAVSVAIVYDGELCRKLVDFHRKFRYEWSKKTLLISNVVVDMEDLNEYDSIKVYKVTADSEVKETEELITVPRWARLVKIPSARTVSSLREINERRHKNTFINVQNVSIFFDEILQKTFLVDITGTMTPVDLPTYFEKDCCTRRSLEHKPPKSFDVFNLMISEDEKTREVKLTRSYLTRVGEHPFSRKRLLPPLKPNEDGPTICKKIKIEK